MTDTPKLPRLRAKQPATVAAASASGASAKPSKLDRLAMLLKRPEGAGIDELAAAVGWQAHSVRGALAGALRKKGHVIVSEKRDGVRRYRIEPAT